MGPTETPRQGETPAPQTPPLPQNGDTHPRRGPQGFSHPDVGNKAPGDLANGEDQKWP